VLAVAYDLLLAARPDRRPSAAWPLDVGLIALAAAAALLSRVGVTPAGLTLNLGPALALVAATYLHPADPIPCGFALLVMLIAALHGWPIGALGAFFCSAIVACRSGLVIV
jgi:hypothetical protein